MNHLNINDLFEEEFDNIETQSFLEDLDFQEILSEMKVDLQTNNNEDNINYKELEERLNNFIIEKQHEFEKLEESIQKPRKEIVREIVKEQPAEIIEPDISQFEEQFNQRLQNWNKRFNALIANMNMRAPTGSSGGSTRILENDDVVFSQVYNVANNQILTFNKSLEKFEVSSLETNFFTRIPITSNTVTINNFDFDTVEGFLGVNNQNANTIINIQSDFDIGKRIIIKDEAGNASKNRIKINTVDNIDGANNFTLEIDRGSITMVYTGFEWSII